MKTIRPLLTLLIALSPAAAFADQKPYADPDGAFALNIPDNWPIERTPLGEGGSDTVIGRDEDEAAKIEIVVVPLTGDAASATLADVASQLLGAIKSDLTADGTVRSERTGNAQLGGAPAVLCELVYADEDEVVWKGALYVMRGQRHAFVAASYGLERDERGLKLAGDSLLTLALESRTPRAPGAAAAGGPGKRSGVFTKGSLARAAQSVKGGFKPEAADNVLVAGDPPLTAGSVANFIRFVEVLYDIRFVESETQLTQERFIEFYNKADAEGRRILAQGAASMLAGITSGTPAEQTENRRQAKAVFDDRLSTGAQQGIVWASVLWDAIQRRSAAVQTVKVEQPTNFGTEAKLDTTLSEADLDASLEMLYFMWVAAGRDAALVTPEAVMLVRARIAQNFLTLPPDVQYLFANAEPVYAHMRSAWQAAGDDVRLAYAQQFATALDSMGLTVPQNQSGGWEQSGGQSSGGGESEWDIKAGLITNTCWNLAQKAKD